ncbi:MAG TPA: hypothetical protein VF135_14765 [Terriglobales bacterium]
MHIDPHTAVSRILEALPASAAVLRKLGLDVTSDDPLHLACSKAGVSLAEVETALESIDWALPEDLDH